MTQNNMTLLPTTMGLDVGDRFTHLCLLDASGEVVERGRVKTTPEALQRRFGGCEPLRIVLEVGTHSPWISRLLEDAGHEVIVANARRVRLIWDEGDKSDPVDAEALARLGRSDPELLRPIKHRGDRAQADRALLRSRAALVRCRTSLVVHARGLVKPLGYRLPDCNVKSFENKVIGAIPDALAPALRPIVTTIEQLTQRIKAYEREIERLSRACYPETELLRQVPGVGPITALSFVLVLEDPARFPSGRHVGSYLGLRPRRAQSGGRDPQLRITKRGDRAMRTLLVQSAHYILGHHGPDSDLKRFGERMAARGGKAAKKRAVVAVARKLAVLLHRLWLTGTLYEPFYYSSQHLEVVEAKKSA